MIMKMNKLYPIIHYYLKVEVEVDCEIGAVYVD